MVGDALGGGTRHLMTSLACAAGRAPGTDAVCPAASIVLLCVAGGDDERGWGGARHGISQVGALGAASLGHWTGHEQFWPTYRLSCGRARVTPGGGGRHQFY